MRICALTIVDSVTSLRLANQLLKHPDSTTANANDVPTGHHAG